MVTRSSLQVVERYFEVMRGGAAQEEELMRLFADDAVYIAPFSGERRRYQGLSAIRDAFRQSWKEAPPQMTLEVESIELDVDCIRSTWRCSSPAFPQPVQGHDVYVIEKGRIQRLEVSFDTFD